MKELWVCWSAPPEPPADAALLSFLSPADEGRFGGDPRLVRAREASQAVRAEARALYFRLVARIGTAPCAGRTLRSALARAGQASRWWYHPVAFKDCEGGDAAFERLIAACTIRAEAARLGATRLVLWGAPADLEAVLRGPFQVEARDARRAAASWSIWLRGLASRVKTAWTIYRQALAARIFAPLPAGAIDVAFSGFWDWSVHPDDRGALVDRYFKRLPAELERFGVRSMGWFAWLDPDFDPAKRGRGLRRALAPLVGGVLRRASTGAPGGGSPNGRESPVVVLQAFLLPRDVVSAAADLRPLSIYLRHRERPEFREAFREGGWDYFPLFAERLLRGFLDGSMPRFELAALSTERASRRYKPKAAASFLEHFHYARAFNEGCRRGAPACARTAVQHASFCREKTFYFFDPELEFRGSPDGCAVPHPDYVFAMGSLGRDLFLESGYEPDHVLLTGSTRYDHIQEPTDIPSPFPVPKGEREEGAPLRLLIAATVDSDLEIEMAEAAALAAREVPNVRVLCRNYPFTRLERHSRFAPLRGRVEITRGTLEEDLEPADIVLFTYSTVAEEAFLRGKPAWQWLPLRYNGSALAEAAPIPQFSSASQITRALHEFQADPAKFRPSMELRRAVCERLFFRGDGGAAGRVARALVGLVSKRPKECEVLAR